MPGVPACLLVCVFPLCLPALPTFTRSMSHVSRHVKVGGTTHGLGWDVLRHHSDVDTVSVWIVAGQRLRSIIHFIESV